MIISLLILNHLQPIYDNFTGKIVFYHLFLRLAALLISFDPIFGSIIQSYYFFYESKNSIKIISYKFKSKKFTIYKLIQLIMDEEGMSIDDSVMVRTEQEGQIAQLRQNLETQKEKNKILQNKIRKHKKEQEQSKALNKTLSKECDHFKFLSKANSQKIEDLQRVNKYLQSRNKFLEEQLQEQKTTIESLNQDNFLGEGNKSQLHIDDFSKIENIESQQDTKISSLTEQNKLLQNMVSELRQQVKKNRQKALNAQNQIHDLEYRMEQKNFELNQLKQNIETINPEEEKVFSKKKSTSQVVAMEMLDILNILKQFLNSLERKKMIKAKNIIELFVQQQLEVRY